MIGFGFFIYSPKEKNIVNVVQSSSGTLYTDLRLDSVQLEEVVNIDDKRKKLTTKPIDSVEPVVIEPEGRARVTYEESYYSRTDNFFVFVSPNPEKKYVITEIAYSFRKSGGKGLMVTVTRRYPVDPYKSFRALPIQSIPGKINFLGTFMGNILETSPNDPYGVEDPNPGLSDVLDRPLVTPNIEPAEKFIGLQRDDGLRDKFYGNYRPTPETMEMHFLNEIVSTYRDSYWEDKARERLAEF